MKKFYLGLIALLIVLGISGCSGNSPSDVAVEFVEEMSNLNISEAKELSSSDNHIKSLEKVCAKEKAKLLAKEAYNFCYANRSAREFKKYIGDILENSMKKEMENAIGYSQEEIENMSETEKNALKTEMKPKIEAFQNKKKILEMAKKAIDTLNIEGKNSENIKRLLVKMIPSRNGISPQTLSRYGVKFATEVLVEEGNNIDGMCLSKYTSFSEVDDINIIESKNHSADEVTVRLEIINEDEKSEKVSIELEKIQDEWKVTNPAFNISMWDL